MNLYWIGFNNRGNGCIEADTEEQALTIAVCFGSDARVIGKLPYPADPRLAVASDCPSFCYCPDECAKLGACWANERYRRCCTS